MKRVLPLSELDKLIQLLNENTDSQYDYLREYLHTSRKNKWGDGTLYAVNEGGAIAFQLMDKEF